MGDKVKLPIKVVPLLERDFYKPDALGGPKKVFREVDREFRQELADQVVRVRTHFANAFLRFPTVPAVAKVNVRADAVAKSHRPTKLLNSSTCPIIGSEGLGELLLSVTQTGLDNLARKIERDESRNGIANISTLDSIFPYKPAIQVPDDGVAKIKLFRHNDFSLDDRIDYAFRELLSEFSIYEPEEIFYAPGLKIFRLELNNPHLLPTLEGYVGVQSIGSFPIYRPVRTAAVVLRAADASDFPKPAKGVDYPVVGVIDSGTAPNDPYIAPWRIAREVCVPPAFQDNGHGSFVSGLIINGRALNNSDAEFPDCSSKIVDIVALEKGGTAEDKLKTRIEDAVSKYSEVKVWNLSLGTSTTVDDRAFSDFGIALDRIQDQYGVTFVLAAGNYRIKPFRGWPPEDLGESDRICTPADSIRSIVVGSKAHREHGSSRVKCGEPSPFSRRGPGPLYLQKPEISHVGGNCSGNGNYSQIGVLSLDANGNLSEDVGTSFAAPLISNLYANITHRTNGGGSPLLTRALLVHSSALQGSKIDPSILKYRGFGTPPDLHAILGCEPWQCTLIFELEIAPHIAFEKAIFPMPACLFPRPGVLRANILMTLVHQTALDGAGGSEYCRSNIEVSMGTYDVGDDGRRHQKKQVPADPVLTGSGYESDLVRYGFKWSPVKVYRREMVSGVQGDTWRLDLSVHHRSGFVPANPERAVLLVTIADPKKSASVYNEMVVAMNNAGWLATDLQVNTRIRP